jgi:hypothetical protein
LTRRYRKSGLVLVLGAGVSARSGLPSWRGLLERISADFSNDTGKGVVARLEAHDVPLPVLASALEEWCGSREEFVRRVRAALYGEFPFSDGDSQQFVDHVAYVHARYGRRLLRSIERASAGPSPPKISVYHLHGMLRFDSHAEDQAKENASVVLTEQDYYDFFNAPTSLFNYTFLYLLREASCLFVGLSMNDQNLRRLLHFSKAERLKGLEDEGETNEEELTRKTRRHFAILPHSGQADVDRVTEDSLLALGTQVLWIDTFDDIEKRLRRVYESAGAKWELVA